MTLKEFRSAMFARNYRRQDVEDERFNRHTDAWAAWASGHHGEEGKRFVASQVYM